MPQPESRSDTPLRRASAGLALAAAAVMALSACSSGSSSPNETPGSIGLANDGSAAADATAGGPLGDVQAGLGDALSDGVVANIPDPALMQFAQTLVDATLFSTDVPDELLATLIAAGELAQAGTADQAAYEQLLTDAGGEMLRDLQAAASAIMDAALQLRGSANGSPAIDQLTLAAASASGLLNAINDPASLESPTDLLDPLQNLIDAVSGLDAAALAPDDLSLPGQDNLDASALDAVLGPLTDGLTSARDTIDALFAQSGFGDAIGGGSNDLLAPITDLGNALGADSGALTDLFNMLNNDGRLVPDQAQTGLSLLQSGLGALFALDDPDAPLLSAEAGQAALASLFGDLTNILPDAACGLLPVAPGCDQG